jgi:hypothetical protein
MYNSLTRKELETLRVTNFRMYNILNFLNISIDFCPWPNLT